MNEFTWTVNVYYEDTDAGGVVYHANYLRFMERARTEWLRSMGFEQDRLNKDYEIIFAVRKVIIDYVFIDILFFIIGHYQTFCRYLECRHRCSRCQGNSCPFPRYTTDCQSPFTPGA